MNRERLSGYAASCAFAAAAWFGVMHMSAYAPTARAHAEESGIAGTDIPVSQGAPSLYVGADDDWSLIREGMADGRYWAWIDQQIAMP